MIFVSIENIITVIIGSIVGGLLLYKYPQQTVIQNVILFSFTVYVIGLLKVTLGPIGTTTDDPLIWFHFFTDDSLNAMVTHWILNTLLFVPLGGFLILAMNVNSWSIYQKVFVFATIPFIIESLQFLISIIFPLYSLHQFALDDVLWNGVGTVIGYLSALFAVKLLRIPIGVKL